MRSWFVENSLGGRIDGLAEHEKFLDYYRANGRTHKDWVAAWRFWMRRAAERTPAGRRPSAGTFTSAQERSRAGLQSEADLARIAEAYLEHVGGDPEDPAQVRPLVDRLRESPQAVETLLSAIRNQNGSASRTSDTYSGDKRTIEGEVAAQREVTSSATERDADDPR
jgi:hypothetical protein